LRARAQPVEGSLTTATEAIVVRQAVLDRVPWPVLGPTKMSGTPMAEPHAPPQWWADALFVD
jgi:hypothetical protein